MNCRPKQGFLFLERSGLQNAGSISSVPVNGYVTRYSLSKNEVALTTTKLQTEQICMQTSNTQTKKKRVGPPYVLIVSQKAKPRKDTPEPR
jgi:hypothetical protein